MEAFFNAILPNLVDAALLHVDLPLDGLTSRDGFGQKADRTFGLHYRWCQDLHQCGDA